MTYFTGSLSLACNIGSGLIEGSYGAAGWGAFVVVMFLVLESVITKIRPAAAVTKAKNAVTETKTPKAPAEVLSPRQIAARKGVETKRQRRELEALYQAESAPVSGA